MASQAWEKPFLRRSSESLPSEPSLILSRSLIIEHLSTSTPTGFAYFYIRFNDTDSQKSENILGSLVGQLCQQNAIAFRDALDFHASYNTTGGSPKLPTVSELGVLLQRISLHFDSPVSIVVDGLDEVGLDHSELLGVLSTLNQDSSNIRLIVFSRAEANIKHHLSDFNQIFIAARPSDLQLYVDANLHKLHLEDGGLEREITEALLSNTDGK